MENSIFDVTNRLFIKKSVLYVFFFDGRVKLQIQQTFLHKTLVVFYGFESVQVEPHDIAWIIHFDTSQVFKYPIEVG